MILFWKKKAVPFLLAFSLALALTGVPSAATAKAVAGKTPTPAPAAHLPGGSDGRDAYFVSLDWVKGNLKGVVLVDARPASLYSSAHVPGAVNAEWQSFCKMKGLPGSRGWATLLAPKSIAARIGALGIDGTRPVIVYGEPGSWGQEGFVALVLRMAGVPGVRVLDGGWPAWRAAGLPVTREVPKPRPANFATKAFRDDLKATVEHIRERMGSAKILDVRTLEEYKGARYFSEKRGGHIPGAVLVPFNQFVGRDGMLLPDGDLKAMFEKAGLMPDDEIIAYDTAGVRSAYATWVLLMLGYKNVRNYDASFHEWAGIPELSVETGDPGELPALVAAPAKPKEELAVAGEPKSQDLQPKPVPVPLASPAATVPAAPGTAVQGSEPASQDAKPVVLKPIPIVVQPAETAGVSADAVPKVLPPAKPAAQAARITALRWNKSGGKIRVVVDLDRVAEPRVLVKPGMVELAFDALPAGNLQGLPSPYEKEITAVLLEGGGKATLRFAYRGAGVNHFQLDKPYRYVIDFKL
jgi:thiosulfate/3-mercaptopyruvate sulfurtransferase